jgi:hypothetical protein
VIASTVLREIAPPPIDEQDMLVRQWDLLDVTAREPKFRRCRPAKTPLGAAWGDSPDAIITLMRSACWIAGAWLSCALLFSFTKPFHASMCAQCIRRCGVYVKPDACLSQHDTPRLVD